MGNEQTKPKFQLGQIMITPGVRDLFREVPEAWPGALINSLLARHRAGDWGEVPPEDAAENELSVSEGFRIMSAYSVSGEKVWVITEADRSVTTLLLPDEY